MKKNDIILIIIILTISILIILFNQKEDSLTQAKVYYKNDIVLTIDMSINGEYDVQGYNGNVHIVVLDNKIKVEEENSPKHLCSKQGFISSSNSMFTK